MRFDLIDDQFDFPALMIQRDQRARWGHTWVEQGGHQTIHLVWFSQTGIGHAVGDDAHPQAMLLTIPTTMSWLHPRHYRAITQSTRRFGLFPCPCFQGGQD